MVGWGGVGVKGVGRAIICATKFGIFVRNSVDGDGFEELCSLAASNALLAAAQNSSVLWLVDISAEWPVIFEAVPSRWLKSVNV